MQDYDRRHFAFERFTGLPDGYFKDRDNLGHFVAGAVGTVIAIVLIVLALTGGLS